MGPKELFLKICYALLTIAVVVICYLGAIWVLDNLGVRVPQDILRVLFVILALLAVIGIVSGRLRFWNHK